MKASFDTSTERFVLKVRAGSRLARSNVENAVAALGKRAELKYEVVWKRLARFEKKLAKHGQPFVAPLLAGGDLDLGTLLKHKPLVLVFWASWCRPCLVEAPYLVALHAKYASKGVAFVAVSIDEKDAYPALRKVVTKLKVPYAVALDPRGEALAKYAQGASIPLTFVLDSSGAVIYNHKNFKPGDEVALETAIKSTLR